MGESWYLACDFQLFLFGPLIVWPVWKFRRLAYPILILVLAASVAIPGGLTGARDWPPQLFSTIL